MPVGSTAHAANAHVANARSAPRLGFRVASARLREHQKPGYGVPGYLRWVNRPLGRWAASAAAAVGLSPTQVTVLSGLASAAGIGIIVAAPFDWVWTALAAALLLAGYALDSADGQLARLTGSSSTAGEWLDHIVDAGRLPAIHLALAIGFFRSGAPGWLIVVALLFSTTASVWFFAQTLAEKLGAPLPARREQAPAWLSVAKLPSDTGFLYLLIPLLAAPALFAVLYTGLFAFTLAAATLSLRRKFRALAGGG